MFDVPVFHMVKIDYVLITYFGLDYYRNIDIAKWNIFQFSFLFAINLGVGISMSEKSVKYFPYAVKIIHRK